MDVVAGYTAADDLTNDAGDDTFRRKAFDGACPLGPAVVAPEDVPDDAAITTRVNGEVRQSSSLSNLVFSVPEILAEVTQYATLEPGDVVLTGTTSGRGPLEDGDRVEVEIEGVGTLSHAVRL
ncbi:fumarylacetoacetate hydrolase family protein [Haloplanus sp. GCM10025708]